jgi:hypothetical protein
MLTFAPSISRSVYRTARWYHRHGSRLFSRGSRDPASKSWCFTLWSHSRRLSKHLIGAPSETYLSNHRSLNYEPFVLCPVWRGAFWSLSILTPKWWALSGVSCPHGVRSVLFLFELKNPVLLPLSNSNVGSPIIHFGRGERVDACVIVSNILT